MIGDFQMGHEREYEEVGEGEGEGYGRMGRMLVSSVDV